MHRFACKASLGSLLQLPPLVTSLMLFCAPALAQTYTAKILFAPMGGGFNSPATYPRIAAGGQVVGFSNTSNAALFSAPDGTGVDLLPPGFLQAYATGTDGTHQVGYGRPNNTDYHALLWSGSANSAVDLHPSGFSFTEADAVGGNQQVGWGDANASGGAHHALLWFGSAGSVVDLNPTNIAGIVISFATGSDGVHQVGRGYTTGSSDGHALLWGGTANSAVDLHPANLPGFGFSQAWGVYGNQQVGSAATHFNSGQHAMLWNGSANSAIDLSPTNLGGFSYSLAYATDGLHQVGYGYGSGTGGSSHALLWSGAPGSAVDLHTLLPGNFISSTAYSIDVQGNIFGVADGYAVEWVPTPEPSSLAALLATTIAVAMRRTRNEGGRGK